MTLLPGMILVLAATVFEVRALPVQAPPGTAFFAHADRDSIAELMVIEDNRVLIYSSEHTRVRSVRLEPGTSVFDIADLDGDGRNEVIAVNGERVCRYPIPEEGESGERELLFEQHTLLTARAPYPAPSVMVVRHQGETVLALPVADALELRRLDGSLAVSLPADASGRRSGVFGDQFTVQPVWPPVAAAGNGLEFEVQRSSEMAVNLPEALARRDGQRAGELLSRKIPASQLPLLSEHEPERWPWFPVRTDGSPEERVLYAPAPPGRRDTMIRMQIPESGANPWSDDAIRLLPARLYPGLLIPPGDTLPDFNDDGHTDLVLWRAPDPGTTVNSLLRTLTRRNWPVYATVHLYLPDKQRYDPRTAMVISAEVPVFWFLNQEDGAPFRNRVLRDFNGNGTTDIGWSTSENSFSAWLVQENKTGETPDFHHVFAEQRVQLLLTGDLAGKQSTSLVLRGEKALYWLYARPPELSALR
jgi:hypothetical protein